MKFAHLSDCHIGSWRETELKNITIDAFEKAIDICIEQHVGFVLISGDLFDNSLPSIDVIKRTAAILKKLKEQNIDVYLIPGSHDFSPSGKTMLDVLERSGLCTNVFKFKDGNLEFTLDKTGAKLTGMPGYRKGLEKEQYKLLNKEPLEKETGFKIFLFHSLLSELKPKHLEQMETEDAAATLPKNFNYYAGGHPHFVLQKKLEGFGMVTYPGPIFPNNFKEVEEFKHGGFYIVDDKLNIEWIPLKLKEVSSFQFDAEGKTPQQVHDELINTLTQKDVKDHIVTIRVAGTLASGKPSDIKLKDVLASLKKAFFVMKNTHKLTTKEFEELKVETGDVEDVEQKIIEEHAGQIKVQDITPEEEVRLTKELMNVFDKEKDEGEKNYNFEERLVKDTILALKLEEIWE